MKLVDSGQNSTRITRLATFTKITSFTKITRFTRKDPIYAS